MHRTEPVSTRADRPLLLVKAARLSDDAPQSFFTSTAPKYGGATIFLMALARPCESCPIARAPPTLSVPSGLPTFIRACARTVGRKHMAGRPVLCTYLGYALLPGRAHVGARAKVPIRNVFAGRACAIPTTTTMAQARTVYGSRTQEASHGI